MATPREIAEIHETSLHGNHLALDFVNTVDWRLDPRRRDLLVDHEVLLHWGRRLGLLSEGEVRADPGERRGVEALARAVELRELLYEVFAAVTEGARPHHGDLQALIRVYADAVAHARLVPTDGGYALTWAHSDPLERVRWAVASAAVELLSSPALERVKQCRDAGCGWVFLDMSKNASRRWCSMQGCGARAKMRRQYRRKKARPAAGA